MTRLRAVSGVLVICALVGLGGSSGRADGQATTPSAAQTGPVFRGGVNYVLVDVYPQRDGRIVEGLTPEDFTILEDGRPQAIDGFEFVRVDTRQPESAYRDPNTIAEMNAAAADPHARVFVVFLDTAHTRVEGGNRIRLPLVHALNAIVGPTDLFGVITQNQNASDLTLQRHVVSVEDQLSRWWTWGQSGRHVFDANDPAEAMLTSCFATRIVPGTGALVPWLVEDEGAMRLLDQVLIDRRRDDRLVTKLEELTGRLGTLREARSVLLLVTDGWALFGPNRAYENEPGRDARFANRTLTPALVPTPEPRRVSTVDDAREWTWCLGELNRLAELDTARAFRDVMALAARSNVSIYPVSSAGLETFDTDVSRRTEPNPRAIPGSDRLQDMGRLAERVRNLRTLAENTGGLAIVQTNDLEAGLKRIVDDVSAYYLLGYYSSNPKADGRYRRIDVKVRPQGVVVRARRGYVAASAAAAPPASASAAASPEAAPVNGALAALTASTGGAELFVRSVPFGGDLRVAVELGSRQAASGDWKTGATLAVTVTTTDGAAVGTASGAIEAGARSGVVSVPVQGTRGPWRVSVKATSGPAALTERVDAAAPATSVVSGPVLSRGTPSPRSALAPVALLEFRRSERIHAEWHSGAALDERVARVLDRRGQPLPLGATIAEHDADAGRVVTADLNLAPLAEGDYVLELAVRQGARSDRSLIAFRVVR